MTNKDDNTRNPKKKNYIIFSPTTFQPLLVEPAYMKSTDTRN